MQHLIFLTAPNQHRFNQKQPVRWGGGLHHGRAASYATRVASVCTISILGMELKLWWFRTNLLAHWLATQHMEPFAAWPNRPKVTRHTDAVRGVAAWQHGVQCSLCYGSRQTPLQTICNTDCYQPRMPAASFSSSTANQEGEPNPQHGTYALAETKNAPKVLGVTSSSDLCFTWHLG